MQFWKRTCPNSECGMRNSEFGTGKFGMRNAEFGIWDEEMWNLGRGGYLEFYIEYKYKSVLRNSEFRIHTGVSL